MSAGRETVSIVDLRIHRVPLASVCDGFGHPSHSGPRAGLPLGMIVDMDRCRQLV